MAVGDETILVREKPHWARRLVNELIVLFLALCLLAAGGILLLDSGPGHRFLVDRIAAMETASGLKIRIARIEGSVFGEARLKGVTVSDPQGVFASSPEITLDWAPGAWLYNRLDIDRLEARLVRLDRLPRLRPSTRKGPILPGFDIEIAKLAVDRLELGKGVTGTPRAGRIEGEADIRAGRAMVGLRLAMQDGDRLEAMIDAEPDRDRFDLDIRAEAPGDGLLPTLIGVKKPISLVVQGDGRWSKWRGGALMTIEGQEAAKLALAADGGRYRLQGLLTVAPHLKGKLQRLSGPRVRVNGAATFVDRVLDGEVSLASASLRAVARGKADLGANAYDKVTVGIDLLQPRALFPNMTGQNVRMVWTLDGPMDRADYAYRLSSPRVAFDKTGFLDVRAEGRGRLTPWPLRLPLLLKARAITGLGDVAGGILGNIRIEGMLDVTPAQVRGDKLALRSDKLTGTMSLLIDLKSGRFDVVLSGGLKRYLIPGLGLVDVTTDLKVVPGPDGKARVVGRAVAQVRRLDNSFFASLTGGLPRLTTDLARGSDGILRLTNLTLSSPKLKLSGNGIRRRDGTFLIEATGTQAEYGPLKVRLDGPIERPRVELFLARPNEAMQIRAMRLWLDPNAGGFAYRAEGQSRLGPFRSNGNILLPKGGRTVIQVAALNVAGSTATGALRADPGGFTGDLRLTGGGLQGTLAFAPVNGAQKVEAHLTANGFSMPGPPSLAMRSGRIDGVILLARGNVTMDGVIDGRGVTFSGLQLARLSANARLVNGSGRVNAALAGTRGSAFDLTMAADVTPGRIVVSGRGQLDRKPLVLESPAVLSAVAGGWQIAPTRVRFGGGRATLSGRTGSNPELVADIQALPMQLLDLVWPDSRLAGVANGRVEYRWTGQPSGSANLRIRGLSRAGLVLTSKPIDVGLNAVLSGGRAAMRAVVVSDGKIIGRAQGRFAPLGRGPIVAELMNAPMLVQFRYAGSADTLWRLSGVELFDLSGPIAVGADIGGRLVDPQIRGSIRANGARLESAVTGTVIENLNAAGRFDGSRLAFSSISGTTPGGGTISGNGIIDFSGGGASPNLSLNVSKARLLARDDIAATLTGPLTIRSSGGEGGTISGKLKLDSGRFTLGQASAAASVPKLAVREIGRQGDEVIEPRQLAPWRLDLDVDGGPLQVRGLGIDSRWSTNLKVGGTADSPRLTGRADLIRGDYDFAGRTFKLSRGSIRFRGESPPDPTLDIRAEAQVQGLDANVIVSGTGLRPEIRFASVPQLPQDELLSRILFGTSITNLSAPEALQLASAVAALNSGSGSLDPINAVRRAVGLDRLRVLPADISTGQKTSLSAGKYIGRKLYVEVITDGQGYSATRIEFQVTKWLSILSSVSTIGRTSANVRVSKDY